MLSIHFAGWAQCRLATDPDPFDEPRGVSGYMRAYSGEPDLDRIIRFQDPPVTRSHTPPIGVKVVGVQLSGSNVPDHPLLRANVNLLDGAKFEGRNGVIAEDGQEPIVPFKLRIATSSEGFERATVPTDPASPYREFNAARVDFEAGEIIARATGISSLVDVWRERLAKLEAELPESSETARPALEERIEFLRRNLQAGGGAADFFPALMEWNYWLRSEPRFSAQGDGLLEGMAPTADPWRARFWFGGWDADAQAFFVKGQVDIAEAGSAFAPAPRRPERMSDIC